MRVRAAVAAALLLAGCDAGARAPAAKPWTPPPVGAAAGQSAPPVDLSDHRGRLLRTKGWIGRSAGLLVFGTTSCPRCRGMVAQVEAVRTKYAGRVEVAAVLLSETAERAEAFAREHGAGFTLLLDPQNSTMLPFKLGEYPHFVLIDKRGVIRYTGHELPDDAALEQAARDPGKEETP